MVQVQPECGYGRMEVFKDWWYYFVLHGTRGSRMAIAHTGSGSRWFLEILAGRPLWCCAKALCWSPAKSWFYCLRYDTRMYHGPQL